jgi:hypothetical protein
MKAGASLTAGWKLRLGAVLALVAIGAAVVVTVATADQTVPLSAVYVTPYVDNDGRYQVYSGPGSGTAVGASTAVFHVHLTGSGKADGLGTITAANGDLLYVQFTQEFDVPTLSDVGPFTVVGGTGRFANASGTGTIIATVTSPGVVRASLEGTISF